MFQTSSVPGAVASLMRCKDWSGKWWDGVASIAVMSPSVIRFIQRMFTRCGAVLHAQAVRGLSSICSLILTLRLLRIYTEIRGNKNFWSNKKQCWEIVLPLFYLMSIENLKGPSNPVVLCDCFDCSLNFIPGAKNSSHENKRRLIHIGKLLSFSLCNVSSVLIGEVSEV